MAKKKRGRGRPKLPKGASKAAVVTLRLQPSERKVLAAAAKKAGLGLSDWMRSILLDRTEPITIEVEKRRAEELNPIASISSDPRAV